MLVWICGKLTVTVYKDDATEVMFEGIESCIDCDMSDTKQPKPALYTPSQGNDHDLLQGHDLKIKRPTTLVILEPFSSHAFPVVYFRRPSISLSSRGHGLVWNILQGFVLCCMSALIASVSTCRIGRMVLYNKSSRSHLLCLIISIIGIFQLWI